MKGFRLFGLMLILFTGILRLVVSNVNAVDGSGNCQVESRWPILAGSNGNTLIFTFTATNNMEGGEISITVPSGWSPPRAKAGVSGYTTATSTGKPAKPKLTFNCRTVRIGPMESLTTGQKIIVIYGDKGWESGAKAQITPGDAKFIIKSKASPKGTLTPLFALSPDGELSVNVKAEDVTPPEISISSLKDTLKISGDSVEIKLESNATDIRKLKLQYRWSGAWSFKDIKEIIAPPLNYLTNFPIIEVWNTIGLVDGVDYQLRVIAEDKGGNIGEDSITITIDRDNPSLVKNKIDSTKDHKLSFGKGVEVLVKKGTLPPDSTIEVLNMEGLEKMADKLLLKKIKNANQLIDKSMEWDRIIAFSEDWYTIWNFTARDKDNNEIKDFINPITISISYPDEDEDGIVDETNIVARNLRIFRLDEVKEEWRILGGEVDVVNKIIKINVSSFSIYTILGKPAEPSPNLNKAVIYPNPFRPEEAFRNVVKIINLTRTSKVRIYTLSGELVREFEKEELKSLSYGNEEYFGIAWDGKNKYNNPVASGLYFILITDDKGNKKILKLSIIRK